MAVARPIGFLRTTADTWWDLHAPTDLTLGGVVEPGSGKRFADPPEPDKAGIIGSLNDAKSNAKIAMATV